MTVAAEMLGWGTGELQFRTCKKPSIHGDDILSHGMSVLSQYFFFRPESYRSAAMSDGYNCHGAGKKAINCRKVLE